MDNTEILAQYLYNGIMQPRFTKIAGATGDALKYLRTEQGQRLGTYFGGLSEQNKDNKSLSRGLDALDDYSKSSWWNPVKRIKNSIRARMFLNFTDAGHRIKQMSQDMHTLRGRVRASNPRGSSNDPNERIRAGENAFTDHLSDLRADQLGARFWKDNKDYMLHGGSYKSLDSFKNGGEWTHNPYTSSGRDSRRPDARYGYGRRFGPRYYGGPSPWGPPGGYVGYRAWGPVGMGYGVRRFPPPAYGYRNAFSYYM